MVAPGFRINQGACESQGKAEHLPGRQRFLEDGARQSDSDDRTDEIGAGDGGQWDAGNGQEIKRHADDQEHGPQRMCGQLLGGKYSRTAQCSRQRQNDDRRHSVSRPAQEQRGIVDAQILGQAVDKRNDKHRCGHQHGPVQRMRRPGGCRCHVALVRRKV